MKGFGRFLFFFLQAVAVIVLISRTSKKERRVVEILEEPGETSERIFIGDSLLGDADVGQYYMLHHRFWKDLYKKDYEADILASEVFYHKSQDYRTKQEYAQTNPGWGMLYQLLADFDGNKLDKFYTLLNSIREAEGLSYQEFAYMTVACIQDIPYVLIHEYTCKQACGYWKEIKEMHDNGWACEPEIKHGIQSPAEFLYNLKGDCDTRSLLLYQTLKHFGYDVAILTSDQYNHAILGINMPVQGDYIKYKGKKYYVWETTAKDWAAGMLPPNCSNLNYWEVVLAS